MGRFPTDIELAEDAKGQADRLRMALFAIAGYGVTTLDEAKRIAMKAMGGELHGHEMPEHKLPNIGYEIIKEINDGPRR